jgi:hypothetical protein
MEKATTSDIALMLKSMAVLQFLPSTSGGGGDVALGLAMKGYASEAITHKGNGPGAISSGTNHGSNLFSQASAHLLGQSLHDVEASDLSDILWAFASVGIHDEALFNSGAARILDGFSMGFELRTSSSGVTGHRKTVGADLDPQSDSEGEPISSMSSRQSHGHRMGMLRASPGYGSKSGKAPVGDGAGLCPSPSRGGVTSLHPLANLPPGCSRSCRAAGGLLFPSLDRHNPMLADEEGHLDVASRLATGAEEARGSIDPESLTKVRGITF